MTEEKILWIALNLTGISPLKFKKLIENCQDINNIFKLSLSDLTELEISEKVAKKIVEWEKLPWKEEIEYIENEGIKVITIKDKEYPELLKQIHDPPFLIYLKGNINLNEGLFISIVGTRNPSSYGIKMAEKFSSELASIGFTIVSGLARGIDTSAHIGALKIGGKTVGVLGSGFKNFYPPENKKLEERMIKNGGIISEFPVNTLPEKYNFPKRNRIISGLSKGVIVIEAGPKSGALITANFALEQGREVFALPGRVDTVYSKGTNKLLREGAVLVEKIEDILEVLNLEIKIEKTEKKLEIDLSDDEKRILEILENEMSFDEIALKSNIEISKLMNILTNFEIKGIIEQLPGRIFKKKNTVSL